ncbi:MAG: hypothetical protein CME64_11580 [Halobacteriovoraceae bacterium]|nr:hypothetical protein [Halobacteriovoraceae bacterium]|tara:strand:+ start:65875 stop:66135 length:261 start_codon:yes stop_codon:yes gene_type:complete
MQNSDTEAWEGHDNDDVLYGNPNKSKEEFLMDFERAVLEEHPEFRKEVLRSFRNFFDLWEMELERVEQVSEQSAPKVLKRFIKKSL